MTPTPNRSDEVPVPPSGRPRWRRALVPLLLLALGGGWWLAAGSAAGQITVSWAGPPRCVGAKYAPVPGTGPLPAIHATRGFRCTVTVVVHNDGLLPVHLDRLVGPYLGAGPGGAVVVADSHPALTAEQRKRRGDAQVLIDRELGGGETHQVTMTLRFRERGCSVARTTVLGFPVLRLGALGRHGLEVAAARDLRFVQAGPSSSCPAP